MRISDWSSYVSSSDLCQCAPRRCSSVPNRSRVDRLSYCHGRMNDVSRGKPDGAATNPPAGHCWGPGPPCRWDCGGRPWTKNGRDSWWDVGCEVVVNRGVGGNFKKTKAE